MIKIAIIGLGLIGGSILKSLSKNDYDIIAISKSSYQDARSYTPFAYDDINEAKGADVVFVCTHINQIQKTLDELQDIVSPSCIVSDIGSIKGKFEKNYKYNYIGSHPMAGTEFSGFDASFDGLFENAKWVINKKNDLLEGLIKEMGAIPVVMGSKLHDESVATISHLPMLISFALSKIADDNETKTLASSGFRDTTRLALTNLNLAGDMLKFNKKNIDKSLDLFIDALNYLKNLKDDERIEALKKISDARAELYDKKGKNNFQN